MKNRLFTSLLAGTTLAFAAEQSRRVTPITPTDASADSCSYFQRLMPKPKEPLSFFVTSTGLAKARTRRPGGR